VLDSSNIRRPRDLDGKTYAGFGAPDEEPRIATMIKADGGTGSFDTATLSTAAYEALYNGRADFTEIFTAWEGIEAEMRGVKLRTFRYDTYGIPEWPSVILVAKQENVTKRAEVYQRFLDVTRRGYEFAAQQPEQAARLFLEYLPDGTFPEPDLVVRSTKALAPVYVASGRWGGQDEAKWNAYTRWLLAQGVVVDGSNRVVTELGGGPLFTNQLLGGATASR
jgi:ABC-type nitrate/sulfonate/bicarbonate transport system substrate-binding protein